jgi:hypothetical protein
VFRAAGERWGGVVLENQQMIRISPTSEQLERALEAWDWIDFSELNPILVSGFGDVFFEGPGGIQMLDTIEGRLNVVAADRAQLQERLNTIEGQDELLLAGLVEGATRRGLELHNGQCFDFKVAPVLGGEMSVETIEVMDFMVKLNIAGQIHRQVKDLPPGTKVGKVTIDEP